jgi:inner membrane protein
MQVFAHAGIGWILAEAGRGDRRFRQAVFLAAVIPDIDGLSLLAGLEAYSTYHDRITHSVPFAVLVSLIGAAFCHRHRAKVVVFTQLAFFSHILGDYFLSGWPIALWFPFGRTEIMSAHALWLGHPVNHVLNAVSVACMIWMGWRFKRTPFEVVSASLDQRVCNLLFRRKTLSCNECGKPSNERCSTCGKPICVRHAPLSFGFAARCSRCRGKLR